MSGTMSGTITLSDREAEIVQLIREDATATYRGIANTLTINVSAIQKHMNILKEKGVIERIGGTRGHWKVNMSE